MPRLIAWLACFGIALAHADAGYEVRPIWLDGAARPITLDYFAWDSATRTLWVPGGNLESVRVVDTASGKVRALWGFASAEFTRGTRTVRLGPSSATIGKAAVYVGNRADSSIAVIDPLTFERGPSLRLAPAARGWVGAPDGIAYVAATREIWVTRGGTPAGVAETDKALAIVDASDPWHLRENGKVPIGGSAEGYAVDEGRAAFFTNVEETGETVMIDVRTRRIVANWKHGCDTARGIAIDPARGLLFVACTARVVAMDIAHGGKVLGSLDTGAGLDNIDYSPSQRLLYAAAAKAGTLTIARVDDGGKLVRVALVPTAQGARGVVVGEGMTALVADPAAGRILVVSPK